MARRPTPSDDDRDSTPVDFAVTTPRQGSYSHDFTLQAIMEMKHSLGELSAKTDRLIQDVQSQGKKIDTIRIRLSWVAGGTAVVGFIFATVLAVLRFVPASWFGH